MNSRHHRPDPLTHQQSLALACEAVANVVDNPRRSAEILTGLDHDQLRQLCSSLIGMASQAYENISLEQGMGLSVGHYMSVLAGEGTP